MGRGNCQSLCSLPNPLFSAEIIELVEIKQILQELKILPIFTHVVISKSCFGDVMVRSESAQAKVSEN